LIQQAQKWKLAVIEGKEGPMKRRAFAICLVVTIAALIGALAAAPITPASVQAGTPTIDQALTGPYEVNASIHEFFRYVAQTFTAGITGTLVGVNVEIVHNPFSGPPTPLHVAIRTVGTDGVPTGTVLGEATVDAGGASLSDFIAFSQVIGVTAGVQYAIVVDYPQAPPPDGLNPVGEWHGAGSDQYPRGHEFFSFDGVVWRLDIPSIDLFFRTYVVPRLPAPGTKADCKSGGWRNFADEEGVAFHNQGQCVAFAVRGSHPG
jgi:hypothetical protein